MSTEENEEYTGIDGPQGLVPLVIVEGFLSSTAPFLWGRFEDHLNAQRVKLRRPGRRKVIFTSLGPVSSLHDRACELFYALRGGTVHYGLEHSLEHSHKPLGRTHTRGLYPSWSPAYPIHFLGHSMGGPTITAMLTLIREGFFDNDASTKGISIDDSMIASVTTVSAPFRGTGIVYGLGETTDAAPAARQLSVGSFITKAVYTLEYVGPLIPDFMRPDFHSESRSLSLSDQTFSQFLKRLFARPNDWAETKDATPYDCTFEAAADRDSRFWRSAEDADDTRPVNVKGKTWFRTYVASMTAKTNADHAHHAPEWDQLVEAGPLYVSSSSLGKFDYASIHPLPVFLPAIPAPQPASREQPRASSRVSRSERLAPTRRMSSYYDSLDSRSPSPTFPTLSSVPSMPFSSSPTEAVPTPRTPHDSTRPGESEIHDRRTSHPARSPQPSPLDLNNLPDEYFANDGVVPVFSQWHPGVCWPGVRCIHYTRPVLEGETVSQVLDRSPDIILTTLPPNEPPQPSDFSRPRHLSRENHPETSARRRATHDGTDAGEVLSDVDKDLPPLPRTFPKPGIFHVFSLPPVTSLPVTSVPHTNCEDRVLVLGGTHDNNQRRRQQPPERHHHLSVMPLWTGTDRQRLFWEEVGAWLEDVDDARSCMSTVE